MEHNIRNNVIYITKTLIPFIALLVVLTIPHPKSITASGWIMIAVLVFATLLFILQPIPLGMAGILITIMPTILGAVPLEETFKSFSNTTIFFLIGVFILAAGIEKTGLHKRIALGLIYRFEKGPKSMIFSIMVTGALMSFIMPEHGVIALLVPILTYILVEMRLPPLKSNFAKITMIGAAYGCTIGSLATPIGGARNPLTIGFLAENGIRMTFFGWMMYSLLPVTLMLISAWFVLCYMFPPEKISMQNVKDIIECEVKRMGKISMGEIVAIAILTVVIVSWITVPYIWEIDMAIISLLGAGFMFIFLGMNWEDIEKHVPWGIILLYGGAISLGMNLTDTGAGEWIVGIIMTYTYKWPIITIIVLIMAAKIITEFMSNTAAVALLLPMAYSIAIKTGIDAVVPVMAIALTGGLAYILIIGTPGNLIAYSSGYFRQRDLIKSGVVMSIISTVIVIFMTFTYWRYIS